VGLGNKRAKTELDMIFLFVEFECSTMAKSVSRVLHILG
jgi:hypothetical protein